VVKRRGRKVGVTSGPWASIGDSQGGTGGRNGAKLRKSGNGGNSKNTIRCRKDRVQIDSYDAS